MYGFLNYFSEKYMIYLCHNIINNDSFMFQFQKLLSFLFNTLPLFFIINSHPLKLSLQYLLNSLYATIFKTITPLLLTKMFLFLGSYIYAYLCRIKNVLLF